MLTLAITSRRRNATSRDQAFYADAEREACRRLRDEGQVQWTLRRTDGRGTIILLQTMSRLAAVAILDALPSIATGVCSYRTIGVEPQPGLEPTRGS